MTGKGVPEIDRMAVKIAHLDRLLSLTGEIIITASNMSILQRHLQGKSQQLDKDSNDMVKNATLTANRISSDLHHLVMDIRLIPIRETFLRFRRLVRDLAKKKGRQVNFEIVGEDTLVDKTVAEKLYEPLAHQIRNAIDHGIEDPLERQAAGKPPQGRLTLTAYKKEGFTYVSVSDDGQGLNEDRIRQTAVERGLIPAAAASGLPRQECFNLIMQPGFSTTVEANEISGRGVGMDVVKSTVEELGGEIIIESAQGRGSSFTYKIPQLSAVNITDALIIRADDQYYAVPIGNVAATQAIARDEIHSTMEQGQSIIYLGSIIPVYDLNALLSGSRLAEERDVLPIIIIEAKNGRIALKVSEFIRPQKLVLIPLPEIFNVRGVTGTTIIGGNQLGLVIEPFELISLAQGTTGETTDEAYLSRAMVSMDEEPAPGIKKPAPVEAGDEEPAERPDTAAAKIEMDGQLAEEFFLEIQNILKELNEDVFQLEKDPQNQARVNTIFRHFHSIKGNLIMTGFAELGAFVHRVETVLDRVRDNELPASQEIIDLLLDVIKILETALAGLRTGKGFVVRDADVLTALAQLERQEKHPEPVATGNEGTFQGSALARLLTLSKRARGANIYQAMIRFSPRFQEPFLVAYLILKRLSLLGDVIDTVPPLEQVEQGLVQDTIKVLFASQRSPEEVKRFGERQLKRHYAVTEFETLLME